MKLSFLILSAFLALTSASSFASPNEDRDDRGRWGRNCTYNKERYDKNFLGEYVGSDYRTLIRVDGRAVAPPYGTSYPEYLAELAQSGCQFPRHYRCRTENHYHNGASLGYKVYINETLTVYISTYGSDSYFYNRPSEAYAAADNIRARLVEAGVCY